MSKIKKIVRLKIFLQTFATKSHLSYHLKMHSDDNMEQEHNCHICSKKFQRLQSLRKHIAQKHERNHILLK